ncbi:MAG: outer membrane protein transport protein, partial [Gammaproteobacteria bacterium]|nr:outer membrane protein transport protein [Gammaproteobacteria bacterium]
SPTFPTGYCASLGATPQGKDGFAELDGSGWAYGYNFGILFDVDDDIRLGFAYRSGMDHDVSGDADFTLPGELSFLTATGSFLDTTLTAAVTLPASTSISYFQNINKDISIMADYTLTSWSSFEELRIDYASAQDDTVTTEAWEDSARISFGLNYLASEKWLYRFGLAIDETPIPTAELRTPRIPGNDRTWITFGVTHQIDKDRSFSLAYARLFVDDTDVNNTYEVEDPASPATVLEHTLSGTYEASVDIISAQVKWNY